jgi:hypothetical protein
MSFISFGFSSISLQSVNASTAFKQMDKSRISRQILKKKAETSMSVETKIVKRKIPTICLWGQTSSA